MTGSATSASLTNAEAHEVVRLLAAGVRDVTVARLCATARSADRELHRTPAAHRRNYLPREHGSRRGYDQHRYDGTDPCLPCRAADSRDVRAGQIHRAAVAS